jgi:hypothetical protein
MGEVCQIPNATATAKARRSRDQVTAKIISFEDAQQRLGLSKRKVAEDLEVPRTTIEGWIERKAQIDAPKALVDFIESPEGVAFLHRLVLAAQVVITLMAPGSIRLVCTFLVLSGLNRFVASSYGSQQKAIAALERELCSFGTSDTRAETPSSGLWSTCRCQCDHRRRADKRHPEVRFRRSRIPKNDPFRRTRRVVFLCHLSFS